MTEDAILYRLDKLEQLIVRMRGDRLTRDEMLARLRISGKTMTDWVRRGKAPAPAVDGKWLLWEVLEWERETSRNV